MRITRSAGRTPEGFSTLKFQPDVQLGAVGFLYHSGWSFLPNLHFHRALLRRNTSGGRFNHLHVTLLHG